MESKRDGDEIMEGKIVCEKGHNFYVHDGILDFQSQEQEIFNSWSKYDKDENLAELNRQIDAGKTDSQRKIENDFVSAIVREANVLRKGFLLDVASGRGVLLRELLKNMAPDVDIISVDLSFHILKQDRLKFKKSYPHARVNYIACDATNLPIQDDSIDMACTFVG
ncbi:MAG: methyltransferase domain-containing protein, partial [Lachnospiraceae bacterium]|nr:methyltransferase domain-containing protein [Lachnospiraceae bacterium]